MKQEIQLKVLLLLLLPLFLPVTFAACGDFINSDLTLISNMTCNGTAIMVNASDITVDCNGYTITYGVNASSYSNAINNTGFDNVTVQNCNLVEGNSTSQFEYAIYYVSGAENGTIQDNNITVFSSAGIRVQSNSDNNTVERNKVSTNASGNGSGIIIYSSNMSTVRDNSIDSIGAKTYGIFIEYASNNTITNNTISVPQADSRGVSINLDSDYNKIYQNNISVSGGNAVHFISSFILMDWPDFNNISNNTLGNISGADLYVDENQNPNYIVDQQITNFTVDPVGTILHFIQTGVGEIRYLQNIKGSGNLSRDMVIEPNKIHVNSSNANLNKAARLTFYSIGPQPRTYIPFANDSECPPSICSGYQQSGTTYFFNVTGFINYTLNDTCNSSMTSSKNLYYNLTCPGTAMNIGSDDIEIDCQGHIINYSMNDTTSYGVYNSGYNNVTVRNCNLMDGNGTTSASIAINFITSPNTTLELNNITTSGTLSHGIKIDDSIESTVQNNNITTSGINSRTVHLTDMSHRGTVQHNTLTTSHSINIEIKNDIENCTIFNNTITANGTNGYGVHIRSNSSISVVSNNTVATYGNIGHGAYIEGNSNMNTVANNTMTTNGDNSNGIYIYNLSNSNEVLNNTVTTNGNSSIGVVLDEYSDYSLLSGNTVTTSGSYLGGLWLINTSDSNISYNQINSSREGLVCYGDSDRNSYTRNIIITAGTQGIALSAAGSVYPDNTNLTNNTLLNSSINDLKINTAGINGTALIDQDISSYEFTGIGSLIDIKNSNNGEIRFTSPVNGTGLNLSFDIKISNNSVSFNSSQQGLNKSANITLYNLATDYIDPVIYKDETRVCNQDTSPACINFTSLNAGTVTFNVSYMSNYSIIDLPCADLTDNTTYTYKITKINETYYINANTTLCQNTYTLNVSQNMTAIQMNSSSIRLDCNDSILDGIDNEGIGINNPQDYTEIQSCRIDDYGTGILIGGSNNTLQNNTLYSNIIGLNLTSTSTNNTLLLNNFTSNTLQASSQNTTNLFYHNLTTPIDGNYWSDIVTSGLDIVDLDLDGFGDSGSDYPYNSANGGNVAGLLTDYAPKDVPDYFCGDSACTNSETCSICPGDCGTCGGGGGGGYYVPYCGDRACNDDETCKSCPDDCGQCTLEEEQEPKEAEEGIEEEEYAPDSDDKEDSDKDSKDAQPKDTKKPVKEVYKESCGNDICGESEDCSSCEADCGSCSLPKLTLETEKRARDGEMKEGERIELIIRDDAGEGIADAEVIIVYESGRRESYMTTGSGVLEFKPLESGKLILNAKKDGFQIQKTSIMVKKKAFELLQPKIFDRIFSINWMFLALASFLVVGIVGYYVYSYRANTADAIKEIKDELDKLLGAEKK